MMGFLICMCALFSATAAIVYFDVSIGRSYAEILRDDIAWCHEQGGTARLSYSKKFEGCLIPPPK